MESLFDKIGADNINLLVEHFYDNVFESSIIAPLFKTDKEEIKRKQFLFLTQFLGGPQLYSQEFGHPRMKMRHLPHAIDEVAKNEWLRCMRLAVDSLPISNQLKDELFAAFPKLAEHMMNR